MKKLVLAVTVLALCSLSIAGDLSAANDNNQQQAATAGQQVEAAQAAPHSPLSATDCSFTFTAGANNTFLQYCVTANGNIVQLETPAGHPQVSSDGGEGYGVCDQNTGVAYYDYAGNGESGNWGPATVVSHNATSVKIARTTGDGLWTLTETITQVAGTSPSAKIAMTLNNNSATLKTALLMRYANVDADGVVLNNLDGTTNSAYGSNSSSNHNALQHAFGLVLQNIGTSRFPYVGFVQNGHQGPAPCNFRAFFATAPEIAIDGSLVMIYEPTMVGHGSATVTVGYKGW